MVLVESRITLGWAWLLLLDLQDGRVGLHDGHNDPVNVVLQAKVDLFLLLNRFHELWEKQEVGTGHRPWALPFFLFLFETAGTLQSQAYGSGYITSSRETELISAARDSEKDVEKRFLAPWMLRFMICPLSSSFCSFRLRLS